MGELTLEKNMINHSYRKWTRENTLQRNHMKASIVRQLPIVIHSWKNPHQKKPHVNVIYVGKPLVNTQLR